MPDIAGLAPVLSERKAYPGAYPGATSLLELQVVMTICRCTAVATCSPAVNVTDVRILRDSRSKILRNSF